MTRSDDDFHSLTDRFGRVHDADGGEQIGTGRLALDRKAIVLGYLPNDDEQELSRVTEPPKEVPDRLVFVDRHGVVGLDGCDLRRSSWKGRLPGWIEVHADHAIDMRNRGLHDFNLVSNLRSEIAGLAMWATLTPGITTERYVDDDNLLKRLVVQAKTGDAKEIGTSDGLRFVPHFSAGSSRTSSGGSHEITERMFVETRMDEDPVPLVEHLKTHRNIQELLVLAYGKPCGQRLSWVSSNVHPKKAPRTGKVIGDEWRGIISTWCGRGGAEAPMELEPGHTLFDFKDIGVEGVRRWVQESDQWSRIVGPLVLWTFGGNSAVEVEVMQIGVALEALGHKIAVRQGRIQPDGRHQFPQYLKLIGETFRCDKKFVIAGSPADGVPPHGDYEAWSDDFTTIYKQSKHADHPLPDGRRAVIAARLGALLLRMWLAQEFSVDPETVNQYAGYA